MHPTTGLTALLISYLNAALLGALLAAEGARIFAQHGALAAPFWPAFSLAGGAASAALALRVVRARLGHPGAWGWAQGGWAHCVMTGFAAAVTGIVTMPMIGAVYGPLLWAEALGDGRLLLIWTCSGALSHIAYKHWRRADQSAGQPAQP